MKELYLKYKMNNCYLYSPLGDEEGSDSGGEDDDK